MNTFYSSDGGKISITENLTNIIDCNKITNKEITRSIMCCIRLGEIPLFNNKPLKINKIII